MRCFSLCLVYTAVLMAADWPRFRGPKGAGISPDQGLPGEIGPDRNVVWKAKTPNGNSSPIVVNGHLFITGHEGDERIVLCYDAGTGSLLWRRAIAKTRNEAPNPLNGPTTPTPATDGRSVFVFFPDFGLIAYDFKGQESWRVPLGPFGGVQGMAVSPLYADGNVVLLIDTPDEAYLAAFQAATGKRVWKVDRPIGLLGSYATPVLYKPANGPAQIVVAGAVELTGYQAKTGERLWWAQGLTYAPAAPPLISGDSVYTVEPPTEGGGAPPFSQMLSQFDKKKQGKIVLSELTGDTVNDKIMNRVFRSIDKNSGSADGVVTEDEYNRAFNPSTPRGGLIRTRLNGKGDVTKTNVLWRQAKGMPYVTAPLLYDGILYVVRDGGILATLNPETGEKLREERLKNAIGEYYASPVAGDGKIYFVNKDGKVSVIRAGAKWELIASGDLAEQVIATPAIASSRVYIRTEATLYCFGAKDSHGAEWSQFRGPNGSGVSDAIVLPTEFGPDKNAVWKTPVPFGHSSPVISGNLIFITGAEGGSRSDAGLQKVVDQGGKLYTLAINRSSGKIVWRREVPRHRLERYQPTNSPASPSPVSDGDTVYVFFGDFGLLAYSKNGVERWRLPLGPFNNVNGHGSSPILYKDLLILVCDQDTDSYLLAVDKKTGVVRWKTPRPESTRSYVTPAVFQPKEGPAELIVPGSYQVTSYYAGTGEKAWWIRGLSWQPKSVPVIDGETIFVHSWESGGEAETPTETPTFADTLAKYDANHDSNLSRDEFAGEPRLQRQFETLDLNGDRFVDERDWEMYRLRRASRNTLMAIRHGGRGDLTGKNVIWSMQKFLPNCPSPLIYQGVLYLIKDGGILTALDAKTGKLLKQGRLPGAPGTYYASPVAGAGKIFLLSEPGKATVIKAGADWEILAVNDLEDGAFATPAIFENELYVRTNRTLYCFSDTK